QLYDIFGIKDACTVGVARSPHQDREVLAVTSVDVDTGVEQALNDRSEAERCGVDDRRFTGRVDGARLATVRDQEIDARFVPLEGRGRERGDTRPSSKVRVGAACQ